MLAVAFAAGAPAVQPASAQPQRWTSDPYQGRALREASALEAQGDLAGAEARLRELAERRPASSAPVFALERVLRRAGRLTALMPLLAAHLEANPDATSVRALELRVLGDADSLAALGAAVRRWVLAEPASVRPYREGARAYVEAGGLDAAAALLAEGVGALDAPPALLLASGDVHAAAGRLEDAAGAWAAAAASDRVLAAEVFARLDAIDTGREAVVSAVLAAWAAPGLHAASFEIGAELALREGRQEEARSLVERGLPRMEAMEGRGFLRAFARKAEDLRMHASAVWAYEQLRRTATNPDDARRSDERLAAAAVAAGDTTAAVAARRRIRESLPAGSDMRRQAWAAEVRIRLAAEGPEAGRAAYSAFRGEFPAAGEAGELAAAVAAALVEAGRREAALEVLDGAAGPGAGIERAFLLLEAGAVPEGTEALREALPDLEPAEATGVLELLLALDGAGPQSARVAARVAALARRGRHADAVEAARDGLGAAAAGEQAPLLALAARAADAGGLAEVSEALRRRIVEEHAESDEFPNAALRLAKSLAGRPAGIAAAMRILEDLVVARPKSPVVPEARRELNRLRAAGRPGAAPRR